MGHGSHSLSVVNKIQQELKMLWVLEGEKRYVGDMGWGDTKGKMQSKEMFKKERMQPDQLCTNQDLCW